MEKTEKIFVSGLYLNKVSDNTPQYVITKQSIHVESLIKWLQEVGRKHADKNGSVRITGMESSRGNRYFQIDTWKPKDIVEEPKEKGFELPEVQVDLGEATPEELNKAPF